MTVKELVEHLQKQDQNLEVKKSSWQRQQNHGSSYEELNDIYDVSVGEDRDYSGATQKYIKVVIL